MSYGGLPERGVLPAAEAGIQAVLAAVRETGTIAGIQTYTPDEATRRAEELGREASRAFSRILTESKGDRRSGT